MNSVSNYGGSPVASAVANSDRKGVSIYYTKEEEAYLSILDTAITLLTYFPSLLKLAISCGWFHIYIYIYMKTYDI